MEAHVGRNPGPRAAACVRGGQTLHLVLPAGRPESEQIWQMEKATAVHNLPNLGGDRLKMWKYCSTFQTHD